MRLKMLRAFTLLELLIVVLIIAVLAALAVPNYLEFQTRAKLSRCMNDMRAMATAVESYYVDYNYYPLYGKIDASGSIQYPATDNINGLNDQMSFVANMLTTPIAYISRIPRDPFSVNLSVSGGNATAQYRIRQYEYINLDQHVANFVPPAPPFAPKLIPAWGKWRMVGAGSDLDRGRDIKENRVYDPTNGTVSDGDIVRCQKYPDNRINANAP